MGPIEFWQLLLLLAIMFLIWAMRDGRSYWWRLTSELGARYPVFSAETTRSTEAEFVRDRLPARLPWWIVFAAIAMLGAALWWWSA